MTGLEEQGKTGSEMKLLRAVLWAALSIFILTVAFVGWVYWYAVSSAPQINDEFVVVNIEKGSSVKNISRLLNEKKLINYDFRFLILVKLMDASGSLKAGEFNIQSGLKPPEIIEQLVNAKPILHQITIPEGLNLNQIAELFHTKGWIDKDPFLSLCFDKDYIQKLGIHGTSSLEGYIFPDTYFFVRDDFSADKIIRVMVKRFQSIWDNIDKASLTGLNKHQVITLASIVEKESGRTSERPKIAGVFQNRLKRKMKLQSDPTVVYGLAEFNGNITRADLRRETPYNTYVIKGLPPGPICNPGKESIEAVLKPENHKYLYFVSNNNGAHIFSKNLTQHNRAVYKYQKKRKKK